ncbi:MAG: hypothetical protein EBV49_12285 [Betaproteobacteria bacterium]|jgi:hypothetical protein|nr:hypothetical protein [Betaproteobacteria bacterium]NCY06687.1 hypothetical protein [Betaproteobacteria bacterium]
MGKGYRKSFGKRFGESVIPSITRMKFYTVLLPTSDGQGNDRAGVKMPDSAVLLATFKRYSVRRSGFVEGNQNGLSLTVLWRAV